MNSLGIIKKCNTTQIRGIVDDMVDSVRVGHIMSETYRQLDEHSGSRPISNREASMVGRLVAIDLLQALLFDIEHEQDQAVNTFKNNLLGLLRMEADATKTQDNG